MASALFGVDYRVRWSDYPPVATRPAGVPDDVVMETRTNTPVLGLDVVRRGTASAPHFVIPDELAVKVFITRDSWRLASLSAASGREQVWLIKHEQAHYDIDALLARDFYQRVRSLMDLTFADANEAWRQLRDHRAATIGRADAVNHDYDVDTQKSRDGNEQWTWWCAVERARQLHRSPLERDRDGRLLKIELIDALSGFGLVTG
jgi:hypothetical protein